MVIRIVQDARRNLIGIRINRPLTSLARPTQTNADNYFCAASETSFAIHYNAIFRAMSRRRPKDLCPRMSASACRVVASCEVRPAVKILKYHREI